MKNNNVVFTSRTLCFPLLIVLLLVGLGMPVYAQGLQAQLSDEFQDIIPKSSLRFEENIRQIDQEDVRCKVAGTQAPHSFLPDEVRSVVSDNKESLQLGYSLEFLDASSEVDILRLAGIGPNARHGKRNYITIKDRFPTSPSTVVNRGVLVERIRLELPIQKSVLAIEN